MISKKVGTDPQVSFLGNPPEIKLPRRKKIRIFTLNNQENLESVLHRLEKGYIIEFHIGPSLFGKDIIIFTNYPKLAEEEFCRTKYVPLFWETSSNSKDESSLYTQIYLNRAGSFHYYFQGSNSEKLGSGYFVVDPVLSFGNSEILPLDSIKCQTVLAKCLGTFDEWEGRLRVCKETGYNMIHFTPIQDLGGSNSSYSIKDHLKLNPVFNFENRDATYGDIYALVDKLKSKWKVLCIGDVVLNHTANETPWLKDHPECTYNMITAPHLIPAAILDGHLHVFSKDVAENKLESEGIPQEVINNDHLNSIRYYLENKLVPRLRLYEFYTADVENLANEFMEKCRFKIPTTDKIDRHELILVNEWKGRYKVRVDMELAVKIFNTYREDTTDEQNRLNKIVEDFKNRLNELNAESRREFDSHIAAAIDNCIAHINYNRVKEGGPKVGAVTETDPLVPRYFTGKFTNYYSVEEEIMNRGHNVMAHNGCIWQSDSLKNFAEKDSNVYLRRELIAWSDVIKLRFGNRYSDCPYLWDLMKKYVEITACVFEGIRLDNCHSTPIHVAEYLLDCARKVKPDLYVVAELFTNSETADNIFVNRLAITSLIREAMSAHESQDLSRLIHRFGGEPVGSFCELPIAYISPSIPHALFYDVSHDNPSPVEKRTIFDLIPSAGLVWMACCGVGNSMAYDQLVPYQINVVKDNRLFPSWTNGEVTDNSKVNLKTGIVEVKRALNKIHQDLGDNGYTQIFVDQMNENIIAVTRHNPDTHESIVLIAHTVFNQPAYYVSPKPLVRNLKLEGEINEVLLEVYLLNKNKKDRFAPPSYLEMDKDFINGTKDYEVIMKQNIKLEDSDMLQQVPSNTKGISEFEFKTFLPGSVIAVRVRPFEGAQQPLEILKGIMDSLFTGKSTEVELASVELNLIDLNHVLYRCAQEELEIGSGVYYIPGYGPLVYAGLQGFEAVLNDVRLNGDQSHPLCRNLREGNWMIDYITDRLVRYKGTAKLGLTLYNTFEKLKEIPRYLIPRYFEVIVVITCALLKVRAGFLMGEFVRYGSYFVRLLSMGSIQCIGSSKSASLPMFSSSLVEANDEKVNVTMAAGLPHFSTGYTRSWGRDTFIAFRGFLLLTERFEEARYHILGYASCLRHGLIPNLLNMGVNARYNSRDAVWWWLYSITCYVESAPKGCEILKEKVSRLYPRDDSPPLIPGTVEQPLYDIIQEAVTVHFQGLSFRERNAGPGIDQHMINLGFNNQIGVDWVTGFVFGGNAFNCGTWMDKMGSDEKSGNKGTPATPRDGSAVELVGLSKVVIRKLESLHREGVYPYDGVERLGSCGELIRWSFKEWGERISKNFEIFFWIPDIPLPTEPRPDLIHRRGIYKDCFGSSQPWADYQLRCNFPIALLVAPELVTPANGWRALKNAERILLGPLGMKTLDPADWNYNGDYHRNDNSLNPYTAHGFNYHQGPEWLWPVGFFLRAKLHFAKLMGIECLIEAIGEVKSYLGRHFKEILKGPWRGLPELTNKNGSFCFNGCRVQAWSMACILEVLYDLQMLENEIN